MQLRDCFNRVLADYLIASTEEITGHRLANFVRGEFRKTVSAIVGEADRLIFKGSVGQGNWARGPWVGIFDRVVTTGAQSGYYPVYLFREDMRGLYLSLNQGMTEAKKLYKSDAKTALRGRAANFRALLGDQIRSFPELTIDLAPSSASNDTAFYEAGNICAKYYPADHLPDEVDLVNDLNAMTKLYETLVQVETASNVSGASDGDEPPELHLEDASKFRMHKRIERNALLSKRVKELHGFCCQVCNINFEVKYGPIGAGFIEAHHMKPLSSLKGKRIEMDPKRDFAVLCSNCHRMVHRSGCVDDMQKFKEDHYHGERQ